MDQAALQEFEPLTHLLYTLPKKAQKGIFSHSLNWTCLDVTREYYAVGTSLGVVFLYDRRKRSLEKLQCADRSESVSCVRMVFSLDYVVAVGTSKGSLYIFQLPSSVPGRPKQLHRFTVRQVHQCYITCLEWSQNAMKLYCGDEHGLVTCTEVNYELSSCKSYNVCKEGHMIVQLSYCYRCLLVSTRFRTFLCFTDDNNSIKQVGTKDRKVMGPFGAVLLPGVIQSKEAVLFASRPGLRLWKANMDGDVQTTYIFKELVTGESENLKVLPDSRQLAPHDEDRQFSRLLIYQETQLVTCYGGALYVLDPGLGAFVGYHTSLGTVLDFAVCGDEIFILRKGVGPQSRNILRVATHKDFLANSGIPNSNANSPEGSAQVTPSPGYIISETANLVTQNLVGAIKDMGEKIENLQKVPEGKREEKIPPWGSAFKTPSAASAELSLDVAYGDPKSPTESIASTDSAREVFAPQTPSPDDPVAGPSTSYTHVTSATQNTVTSSLTSSQTSSSTLTSSATSVVPSVESLSKDIQDIRIFDEGVKMSTPVDGKVKKKIVSSNNGDDDLVVRQKVKKKKGKGKLKVPSDNVSLASIDSNSSRPQSRDVSPANRDSSRSSKLHASVDSRENTPGSGDSAIADNLIGDNQHSVESDADNKRKYREQLESELTGIPTVKAVSIQNDKSTDNINTETSDSNSKPVTYSDDFIPKSISDTQYSNPLDLPQNQQNLLPNATSIEQVKQKPAEITPPKQISKSVETAVNVNKVKINVNKQFTSGVNKNTEHVQEQTTKSIPLFTNDETNDIYPKNKHKQSTPITDDSMDIYSKTPAKQGKVISDENVDDFYSKYTVHSPSEPSIHDMVVSESRNQGKITAGEVIESGSGVWDDYLDAWMEFPFSGEIQCLCVTDRYVWCVDKCDCVFFSNLLGPNLDWKKTDFMANQVSVSPDGWVYWRLYKNKVYAGKKVTTRALWGSEWIEVLREVAYISVANGVAWYINTTGEISVQKALSRERPHYRSVKVPCEQAILQVSCRKNVVWAITEDHFILVRGGVQKGREEGTDWIYMVGMNILVSSVSVSHDDTAWIVDLVGRVWYIREVTPHRPTGNKQVWQVSLSEYLMHDASAWEKIRGFIQVPQMIVTYNKTNYSSGVLSAQCAGVWASFSGRACVHISRGSVTGYRWEQVIPTGMLSTVKWTHLSAGAVDDTHGFIWTQQPNGSMFCFPVDTQRPVEIFPPESIQEGQPFKVLVANPETVWGLSEKCRLYIRIGIGSHCPQGVKWVDVDLTQLGKMRVSNITLGSQSVWAVTNCGHIFMRIGVRPPVNQALSPAWVPVEGSVNSVGAKFVQVVIGPNEWMVWALDSNNYVYVRKGVTESLSVGTHWSYVQGITASYLSVCGEHMCALDCNGEVYIRYGITQHTPVGDYWKKLPGALHTLSVTQSGEMWGIDKDHHLTRCFTDLLKRKPMLTDLKTVAIRGESIEGDWEML